MPFRFGGPPVEGRFLALTCAPLHYSDQIIAVLCGVVWGLWIGFAIIAAGECRTVMSPIARSEVIADRKTLTEDLFFFSRNLDRRTLEFLDVPHSLEEESYQDGKGANELCFACPCGERGRDSDRGDFKTERDSRVRVAAWNIS